VIVVEQQDSVRVLRLQAAPSNVLSLAFLGELAEGVRAAGEDKATRCLVLESAFPRYFSTGLDLSELAGLPRARRTEPFERLLRTYRLLRDLPKPTVAAIGGSAILGGWIVAMACDFRLLTPDGRISLSEIRLGLSATSALIARLREMAASQALVKDLVLRGKTLRAPEALAGGFVDRLVPTQALREEALKQARALGKLPAPAYASIKRSLSGRTPKEEEALWRASRREFDRLFFTSEAQEGLTALHEKRRPRRDG
jgi:enoyl-CoA hydratase/carnithine racemase